MSRTSRRLLLLFLPAVLVLALHGILSLGFDAYSRFPPLDIPVHLAGGLAIAVALDGCLSLAEERSLIHVARPVLRLLLLVSLITTAATAWELVEFTSDWLVDTGAQKGLEDTLSDIVVGVLGGTLAASGLAAVRSCKRKPPVPPDA